MAVHRNVELATSVAFRCDEKLLIVGDLIGTVYVFDAKSRTHLHCLKGHSAEAHLVPNPRTDDKFYLFCGGDDSVVKYWDVTTKTCLFDLLGHKDYVRCRNASLVRDDMFASGSCDHNIRIWVVRGSNSGYVMELNTEKPVESMLYLSSRGLIATAGGNFVKIWDVIGSGKLLYSMESHNNTQHN
ncbi:Protein SLOW WALKER 1 [Forsythia ovata]|uniref:Protein SLOW WALKER 1 n=1 Tax=Forsythia ovata TaxID=205694 RepID=A0ABD1RI90_9LAMI